MLYETPKPRRYGCFCTPIVRGMTSCVQGYSYLHLWVARPLRDWMTSKLSGSILPTESFFPPFSQHTKEH